MKVSNVFNGPVEVGLRSLVILIEAFPDGLDLQRLVTFDYLIVHSGDVTGGPASLHPSSPLRAGEVAIRRTLIENGLHLYAVRGLVTRQVCTEGFIYIAEDVAASFVDAMRSEYAMNLRLRAQWAFEAFGRLGVNDLEAVLSTSLSRWRTEFAVLEGEEDRT